MSKRYALFIILFASTTVSSVFLNGCGATDSGSAVKTSIASVATPVLVPAPHRLHSHKSAKSGARKATLVRPS
jgi:hypothetical protein